MRRNFSARATMALQPAGAAAAPARPAARLDGLTGLRGFAVLVVFLSHGANAGFLPQQFGQGVGQLGVMLFFILSGFLMGMLYLERPPSRATLRRYVASRLGRVVPLFYLVVALSVLAVLLDIAWPYPITDAAGLARHLLLISGTRELWAVPVEIQFYAIFILIWLFCHGQNGLSRPRLALALTILMAAFCAQVLAYHLDRMGFVTVFYHTPFFLTGIVIALRRDHITALHDALPASTRALIGLLAILAFLAVNPNFRAGSALSAPIWADPLIWAALVLLFLCSLTGAGVFRWLAAPPMLFLGEISYGFYLFHAIFLKWAQPWATALPLAGRLAALALVGLASLIAARLSLILLERPLLDRAKAMA